MDKVFTRNGQWLKRSNNSKAEFPEFSNDTVNIVIPIINEFLEGDVAIKEFFEDEGLNEYEQKKMLDAWETRDFRKIHKIFLEVLKPKEYKDFSEECTWTKFVPTESMSDEDLEKMAKEVSELSRNSQSFCTRGKNIAKSYLKKGGLYIMTREATNVKTGEREPVPEIMIAVEETTLANLPYRVYEFGGNEESQDIHARNIDELNRISQLNENNKEYVPGFKEFWESKKANIENVKLLSKIKEKIEKIKNLKDGEDYKPEEELFIRGELVAMYEYGTDFETFGEEPTNQGKVILNEDFFEWRFRYLWKKYQRTNPGGDMKESDFYIYLRDNDLKIIFPGIDRKNIMFLDDFNYSTEPTPFDKMSEALVKSKDVEVLIISTFSLMDYKTSLKDQDAKLPDSLRVITCDLHVHGADDLNNVVEIMGNIYFNGEDAKLPNHKLQKVGGKVLTEDEKEKLREGQSIV